MVLPSRSSSREYESEASQASTRLASPRSEAGETSPSSGSESTETLRALLLASEKQNAALLRDLEASATPIRVCAADGACAGIGVDGVGDPPPRCGAVVGELYDAAMQHRGGANQGEYARPILAVHLRDNADYGATRQLPEYT